MTKGYWILTQYNILEETKYSAYAQAANITLKEFNSRILIAGNTEMGIENGLIGLQTVIVEFDTYETALTAYNSPSYKDTIIKLDGAFKRDFRIIRGSN